MSGKNLSILLLIMIFLCWYWQTKLTVEEAMEYILLIRPVAEFQPYEQTDPKDEGVSCCRVGGSVAFFACLLFGMCLVGGMCGNFWNM